MHDVILHVLMECKQRDTKSKSIMLAYRSAVKLGDAQDLASCSTQSHQQCAVLFVQLLNKQSESGKAELSHAEIADRCSDRSWELVRRKKQRPESRLLGLRA